MLKYLMSCFLRRLVRLGVLRRILQPVRVNNNFDDNGITELTWPS